MSKDIELSNRIGQIVEYFFADPTQSYTALANHFGISVARISQIMSHPKVLASYPILAKRRIKSLVPKAVGRLEKLMNQNVNLQVSEKVVSKILDSEKVLEPAVRTIRHEIEMKSVQELKDIIEASKSIPTQAFEAEIVSSSPEEE